ncbi:MAG: insulinase family protein [Duncaniella sp.]|nr:insulinase family protein [Duncaniella sp.]
MSSPCYATLPCGLRLVAIHRPGAVADHCGVTVRAGSRDEAPGFYGLAHFVEHTIFKGTPRRRSWHILNRMESIGGELNAYTTKEETVVYTTYPSGALDRALDLLADLVQHSIFPTAEIDRERQVVEDEIDTYLDIPSEGIFDDYDELIYAGTELAHPILGSRESIQRLTSDVCREYLRRYYTPANMVLFYSGAEAPERVAARAARYFTQAAPADAVAASRPVSVKPGRETFDTVREIGTHQAHTVLGSLVAGMYSPDRYALALLTNIIGGPGMNSLLNVALRERRGLVYTVDASLSQLTDTGLFSIYYGCDTEDVERCRRLATEIITSLAETPLTPRRLDAAKRQYLGQMALSSTNTEQAALSASRSTLLRGRVLTRTEITEAILALTPTDLLTAASSLLPLSRLTLR